MITFLLIIHFLWIAFIVAMVPLIALGGIFGWEWVRKKNLRLIHIGMMGLVLAETIFAITCPLTWLENYLRPAGGDGYENGFVEAWLSRLIYYDFDQWVFVVTYGLFLGFILVLWKLVRPNY